MEKEENQNNTPTDENQNVEKETEKPEENLTEQNKQETVQESKDCLLYTSPSPRDCT